MINTTQQVGGSIGVALLNTIAASATTSYVVAHGAASEVKGLVHGFATAYLAGAGFMILAIILTLVLINARREDLVTATEEALAF
jgi:hypothetical protein